MCQISIFYVSWINAKLHQWYILENIAIYVGKIHYSPTVFTQEPLQSQAQEIAREPKGLKKEKETYTPAFTNTPQSDEIVD